MLSQLFSPYSLGATALQNRIVMSPMTRSRAIGNIANELMATYYAQRASAGLIISEGIGVSPGSLGYSRMPGLFTETQTKTFKLVTSAVHRNGGKIFAQLMHVGRIAHTKNLPTGAEILAPSAIQAKGKMWTDSDGLLDFSVPKEMTPADIKAVKQSYVEAAKNAIEAGFDGVELHGANGYLPEQFLSPFSNERFDEYGGTIEKRSRFVLETLAAIGAAIGFDKLGVRFSPYSIVQDMQVYPEIDETYLYLAEKLDELGLVYIHLVDNTTEGLPSSLIRSMGKKFSQTIILAGNYTKEKADKSLEQGLGNLIAFGRPFINNPDLVTRFRNNWPLGKNLDSSRFFSAGKEGYTDYPAYQEEEILV